MTPKRSETVGCKMLPEFLDKPESDRADVGGESGPASQRDSGRILDEFLDQAPGDEPPTC